MTPYRTIRQGIGSTPRNGQDFFAALPALTSAVSLLLFVILAVWVTRAGHEVRAFDQDILRFFHTAQTPFFNAVARFFEVFGSLEVLGGILAVGIVVGFIVPGFRSDARTLVVAGLAALLLLTLIKMMFHRTRPDIFVPLFPATGYSFPSGHAFLGVVVYGLISYFLMTALHTKGWTRTLLWTLLTGIIVLLGVSRAYAGVHYATDVLGGWAIGIPFLHLSLHLYALLAKRDATQAARKQLCGTR